MNTNRRLWRWLGLIFVLSFGALGYLGRQIYLAAPPIPHEIVTSGGALLFTGEQIQRGQQAWLSAGGQQMGTVWGHGSYVAPDWSADWLHREATALQAIRARALYGKASALSVSEQAAIDALVREDMRRNTFDEARDTITVSPERAQAIHDVASHFEALFGSDPSLATLRSQYAMVTGALPDAEDRKALTAFFFWTAWATATDRPGETGLSYTSNWPHEPLVGNTMSSAAAVWSMVSIVLLLAGIAAMLWLHGGSRHEEEAEPLKHDPFLTVLATPSMKATRKYFFAVVGLILLQIGMGAITAHYAVEGESFFGFPLAQVLPYVISRTVHTQIGIFWIATAWLATGLYIAPLLSGREPKYQRLGVDLLFWALIAIVVGSTATGWLGTLQHRGVDFSFWLGNQGLEFTSMGRVWQLLLFVGLLFWVLLLGRALWPALKTPSESRGLIAMVFLSATCIGGFYSTSLVWGQHTHYSMIEYWRWWLVHLWVEGFFEVFATAVVALIFTRLGLVRAASANRAIVAETIVFLFGGILGTLHHLYFTGTPTSVISVGAVFSALEVVPLSLIGLEALRTYRRSQGAPWLGAYRWPVMCFVAVGFWNTVGAGLLGFAINPPASLYYVQGLNMTAAHGHAALFGVYGMLGIGLMLFCLRGLYARSLHADRLLKPAFWGMNLGLAMMVFMSLLPAGIYQAWASVTQGMWYARSPEVVHSKVMEMLVWLRVPGDIVFAGGALLLAWYALRLLRRPTAPQPEAMGVAPDAIR
ncbi:MULTISPECIES: nitric-oxide reductase large subunit [Ralstonia solanacearum species complex]|uniref:nitric-oxide reductase large subunit n=1 Tax=Ralstonia solanacearum species complex TaxID=3116862 RepID=UPI000E58DEBF|nr:nitric-oxide reductase large subunit [Ralstonia solanacearum]BEU73469.1 nitric-oxide reductase large subunit [Ralstonia pseudosolanacearum]AXV78252.1 nitric oxide reductase large subunit [Ralstonia solanacearum]AXV92276.1 nitric oxide reductase large subunit [Ralstonia solanacearum]AXW20345.1 nitric oxide reductase large subunit [Ralstonia solanacearum]AXW77165.1 nitric oxide reductase large subunit [Ralstonia solanacearum]